ncbi:MAG: hypothetical protein HC887_01685 [Desulfobacteraceae bacterium]|nr:hypothetical protein [Desulfobacteraceae bacterium]
MIKLLFIGVLAYFGYQAIKPWLSKHISIYVSDGSKTEVEDMMVKDPQCETFFPKRQGVSAIINGQEVFFCSQECRDKYLGKQE